jgi:hypothetical protein
LEKNDLGDAIISSKTTYARKVKVAWYPTLWDRESSETTHAQEMYVVLDFHASEIVHGWYVIKTKPHHLFQIQNSSQL